MTVGVEIERKGLHNWMIDAFDALPRCQDAFFQGTWQKGRLRYKGEPIKDDVIAEFSARLICAAINEKRQLLLLIPETHRKLSALLLSTALVMSSIDLINIKQTGRRVFYFGLTTGIKSDISSITITGLSLSQVFTQTYHRGTIEGTRKSFGSLPSILCVYSPRDPTESISRFSPLWVAIDCADTPSIWWLQPLLKYLCNEQIPTIAWSTNPLSSVRTDFQSMTAQIFQWPSFVTQPKNNLDVLASPETTIITYITPHIMTGSLAESVSDFLKQAYRALSSATATKPSRLGQDALAVGWRYLRSLERLVMPFDLFESESSHYWGIKSISRLKDAFDKFISIVGTAAVDIREQLDTANYYMGMVYEIFQSNDPPYWDVLVDLCLLDVPEQHARVFVFSSAGQKAMFTFALLARANTSEDDLAKMRIWLLSFKDAIKEIENFLDRTYVSKHNMNEESEDLSILPKKLTWDFIHVNIPNQINSQKISPFLRFGKCDFIVYRHQVASLNRLVNKWGEAIIVDNQMNMTTLSTLCHIKPLLGVPCNEPSCRVCEARTVVGKPIASPPKLVSKPLWEPRTEVEETELLFREEEPDVMESDYEDILLDDEIDLDSDQLVLIDTALEVKFTGGWSGLFRPDTLLHIVQAGPSKNSIERRYVKSLRQSDTVVYISGQRRQSLYELVLSRVHRHPSIEIHLAIIRQWQSEIRQGYANWRQEGKTLGDLLYEMRKLGSNLETDMALRFWIAGVTLRPRDRLDMRRIAEILNLPFVRKHYERVYLAAERIVGLHISLSLRLNNWIQSGALSSGTDELIDEATGLSFSDVQDSLLLLKVESVSEVSGPFYESTLGKIERSRLSE